MSDIALVEHGLVGQPAPERSESAGIGRRADGSATFGRKERVKHGLGGGRCDQDAEVLDAPSASDVDRWQKSLRASDGVRWGLIDQVRASIQRGEYLTDDRLAAATQHLARDLSH